MTNADNPHHPSPDGRTETLDRDAPGTLSERVRSLRLGARPPEGRSPRLPWVVCLLLLGSTVAFGYQAFRKPRTDDGAGKGQAEPAGKTADSADVVLQAKGYIIPAHQIQVSPLVGGRI